MPRLPVLFLLAAFSLAVMPTHAAEPAPPPPQPDLYTVSGMTVDASSDSATMARDVAMAQGRPAAFTKLVRRLTASTTWGKEPQLDDNQVLRLVRSFEVANERRSTTRYVADVTFHFNPGAVRQVLRRLNVTYTDARARPAVVIPLIEDSTSFDPLSPWAMAFADPALQLGLVPIVLPEADIPELDVLKRPDFTQVDWMSLMPLVERYNASEVVFAIASEDAKSVQVIEISMTGRKAGSFAYAQSTFAADATAVGERIEDSWKTRSAVDFGRTARMVADVQFGSLGEWAKIRAQLATVRAVADFEIIGLAVKEAQINLTYYGRPEQLIDTMAQQNLTLSRNGTDYTLQLVGSEYAARE